MCSKRRSDSEKATSLPAVTSSSLLVLLCLLPMGPPRSRSGESPPMPSLRLPSLSLLHQVESKNIDIIYVEQFEEVYIHAPQPHGGDDDGGGTEQGRSSSAAISENLSHFLACAHLRGACMQR
mmetsp:Transcript_32783/g.78285  ORF Transcript_32783/g.78285 Transcript_32783/m.78285 type:complete len:123 (+) Transcript_32783:1077-1445(+)